MRHYEAPRAEVIDLGEDDVVRTSDGASTQPLEDGDPIDMGDG